MNLFTAYDSAYHTLISIPHVRNKAKCSVLKPIDGLAALAFQNQSRVSSRYFANIRPAGNAFK